VHQRKCGKAKIQKGGIEPNRANSFRASGNNLTEFVYVMCRKTGIKIWVEIFGGPAPLKFVADIPSKNDA